MKKKIVFSFNIALFVYLCTNYLVAILFDPYLDDKVLWDKAYNAFPTLSIILAITVGVCLILWGAKLLELFWNRLISDIFSTRDINFQEALAIVLVISTIVI